MPEHGGVVTMERHHTGSGASRADRHRARSRLVWLLAALTPAPLILGIGLAAAFVTYAIGSIIGVATAG